MKYLLLLLLLGCGLPEPIQGPIKKDMTTDKFVCSETNRLDPFYTIMKDGNLVAYWDCKLEFFCRPKDGKCMPLPTPTIPATYYDTRGCIGPLRSFPGAVLSLDKDSDSLAWDHASYVQFGDNWYRTDYPEETFDGSYRTSICNDFGRGTWRVKINSSGYFVKTEDFYKIP